MRKYTSWLGVVMVIFLAACGAGRQSDVPDFSSTMLTGQVLQRDENTVTLNLGELVLQTPESAASMSLFSSSVAQPRISSHTAPDSQTVENETRVFISWQRDTVLDLSEAECFTVGQNGAVEKTASDSIVPQDILNITMDANNIPVTVFVLTGISKSDADPESLQGTAASLIMENTNQTGGEYESENTDENALRVLSATVNLHNVQVNKAAGAVSDQTAGDRYGKNAALLATGGANLTFEEGTVDSAAEGSSGIFGHGNGTSVRMSNSTVTTTGDQAEGIQVSGKAKIQAKNMTVTTAGDSSAVLWAENGSLDVNGGTYTSGGYNSPAIFASGELNANGADLTANNSAVAVLQGPCTITLKNCDLRSNATGEQKTTQGEESKTIVIQGEDEPEQQTISFSMSGGSLVSQSDTVFWIADTACDLTLEKVQVQGADGSTFLYLSGTTEVNSPAVTLNASHQTIEGNLMVDSNSTLHLNLQNSSLLHGAILLADDSNAVTNTSVHIGPGCTWSLTGDSSVNMLENEGTIQFNGYSITLGDGTVLTS